MNLLFITGPGRSGTTAVTDYLNQHPEVLVGIERYKGIRTEVSPSLFTRERMLDYRGRETNTPIQRHKKLLNKKDPEQLRWIGDKAPGYVKALGTLAENNPSARFIVMYRPLEEVVESYVARSQNPKDRWLGGKDGFNLGIRDWNNSIKSTREFVRSGMGSQVLILSYHDFFSGKEECIPLISRFLGIEFDDSIRETWKTMSSNFEDRRRRKSALTDEQRKQLRQSKHQSAENWNLKRIEKQYKDLAEGAEKPKATPDTPQDGWHGLARELMNLEMEALTSRSRRLEQRVGELEQQLRRQEERRWSSPRSGARELLARARSLRVSASRRK